MSEIEEFIKIKKFFLLKEQYYKKYYELYKHNRDKELSSFYSLVLSELEHKTYNDAYKVDAISNFLNK